MLRSLKDKLKHTLLLIDDAFDATAATASVDLQDYNSVAIEVSVGAFTFTGTNKLSLTMQHSDDNSAWSNCTNEDIFEAEDGDNGIAKVLDDAADASMTHVVHYRGNKRYHRLNIVEGGTVSVPLCATAVRGHSELMPPL